MQNVLNQQHNLPIVEETVLTERIDRENSWDGSPRSVGLDGLPIEFPSDSANSTHTTNGTNGANSSDNDSDSNNNPPSFGGPSVGGGSNGGGTVSGPSGSSNFRTICYSVFSFITSVLEQFNDIFFM